VQPGLLIKILAREPQVVGDFGKGNLGIAERIKNAMGVMVKGRSVQITEKAFELREAQSAYNAIFGPENRIIDPK
jgi:hypothetical protein